MRLTLKLLPRDAVAYALLFFALVPLFAYSQRVGAPPYGIVVADMDRSVKPGDDFYHYPMASGSSAPKFPRARVTLLMAAG